jgi:hypothetical protein
MHVRHGNHHNVRSLQRSQPGLTISCDECAMRASAACAECVVSYVLATTADPAPPPGEHHQLDLDPDEARVVELMGAAGLVPRLRYARRVRS